MPKFQKSFEKRVDNTPFFVIMQVKSGVVYRALPHRAKFIFDDVCERFAAHTENP